MSLNEQLWSEAEKLASQNYDVDSIDDTLTNGDKVIVVTHPELPGCMAHAATLDEALANLKEARTEYIYSLLLDGLDVPYPRGEATCTRNSDYSDDIIEVKVVESAGGIIWRSESPTEKKGLAFSFRSAC
jgi:predicted RNase H-like HicB family nuclease